MHWRIKGLVQKALSGVPGGIAINDALQRTIGGLRNVDEHIADKVTQDWVVLAAHMRELGVRLAGQRYMEIGTGWYPTLPACFQLAGAETVVSFDLSRHLNSRRTEQTWRALEPHLPKIAAAAGRPLEDVRRDYAARPMFDYRAPADATATGLPDNSIDIVFSNSVLEHVPHDVIRSMMREACRVLRPGGLSIHSVNCADHYAYFDKRITFINYLAFADREWQLWNNELQYQNRLRPIDFLDLSEQSGLQTVLAKHTPKPSLMAQLPRLTIAPQFRTYTPEQLCCTSVDFVGQKP